MGVKIIKNSKSAIIVIFFFVLLSCGLIIKPLTVSAESTLATRVYGDDRYLTSVAISQKGWTTASTVIIASGMGFPDALSASALSKSKDAPILLTDSNSLKASTIEEIQRLKATQAIIVGGTGVISVNIESQLTNVGVGITRVGGADRYETSKLVAKLLTTTNGIIIASGSDFPDALSIAAVAGMKSMPILLSPKPALDLNISEFIAGKSIPVSYIVGGTGALSLDIDSTVPLSKRLSGFDRYATNLAVLKQFSDSLNFDTVYLVAGNNFPDALCAAALAAKNNAPVILTDKDLISQDCINLLKNYNVKHIVILGGTGAVSQSVQDSLDSKTLVAASVIDEAQSIPLYHDLKAEIISNMQNRTTTFSIDWKGPLKELMDTCSLIFKDIMYTNPYEYYNMHNMQFSGTQNQEATISAIEFTLGYRTTKAQEDYVIAMINDIIPKITNASMSTANKELAIHDWVVNNAQYDISETRYTAYDVLKEHLAVCQGYALLTYKMLLKAGIQNYIVTGTANNGQETASHGWNLANIDGIWYHLDTTWDDPISSRPILEHIYYNLTDDEIGKDHFWDKTLYPAVSKVPFVK